MPNIIISVAVFAWKKIDWYAPETLDFFWKGYVAVIVFLLMVEIYLILDLYFW